MLTHNDANAKPAPKKNLCSFLSFSFSTPWQEVRETKHLADFCENAKAFIHFTSLLTRWQCVPRLKIQFGKTLQSSVCLRHVLLQAPTTMCLGVPVPSRYCCLSPGQASPVLQILRPEQRLFLHFWTSLLPKLDIGINPAMRSAEHWLIRAWDLLLLNNGVTFIPKWAT